MGRPIDVDDSDYWLLSNLERHVAAQLDPGTAISTSTGSTWRGSRITPIRTSAAKPW